MMDIKCTQISLCFLLTAALCLEAYVIKKRLGVTNPKQWLDARRICRQQSIDLMPFHIVEEIEGRDTLLSNKLHDVWIGNYADNDTSSAMLTISLKRGITMAWFPSALSLCGSLHTPTGKVNFTLCSNSLMAVCLFDNLELVKEKKTWEEALQHCRDKSKCKDRGLCHLKASLLTLKNPADYDYVRERINVADTDEVWTGLRFLGGEWFWVDGEELTDEGELPRCPSEWKHCGTLSKTNKTKWITRDCSEKRNFVCTYITPDA